jgi:tetratricopeptide (TPR) repeat protein
MATSYITDFIQSLSSEEIKIVKEYVYKSNSRPILGENKIEKLFDTLIGNPEKKYTDKELSNILESNAGALRVLKSRLFEKIEEALVLNKHFENPLVFNHREQMVFTLKKKVLLIKSLFRTLNQGRIEAINFLIAETIKLAEENEVYDVLIETLIIQKHVVGMRTGFPEFERIHNKIISFENCLRAIQNANDAYYKLILNQEFVNSLTRAEFKQHICNSIKQLETDFKITKSQEVNYYLHIFRIVLYDHEKDFLKAIENFKKLLAILKKSKVIYSKDRIGFALSNLGQLNILTGNYKEALSFIKRALDFHLPNSMSYLVTKEQRFYAHFYAKNHNEALKCLEEMLQHSTIDSGEYRKSKFIYFKACVLFSINQFKGSLQLLKKSLEVEKDKTGWNIALRILMTMIFIDLHKVGEASTAISTLRKHIERTNKIKEVKPRDILILKLLRELEKDGFKRNEKNKTAVKLLAELSDKDKPTAWNYFTPELIPFHEWVKTLPQRESLQKTNIIKA